MNNKVEFLPSAQKEIERSYEWYEEQSIGLGERFLKAVSSSAIKILKNPTAYPKKKGNSREFQLGTFPFVIVYRYIESTDFLVVIRVFHTKRNPKYKYRGK